MNLTFEVGISAIEFAIGGNSVHKLLTNTENFPSCLIINLKSFHSVNVLSLILGLTTAPKYPESGLYLD